MIAPGPLLRERTTIRLGGKALAEVCLESEGELDRLPGLLEGFGGEQVVLGRGSNFIFADGHLPLVLISLSGEAFGRPPETLGIVETPEGRRALVRAGGATGLPRLLKELAELNLGGLEGLAGIPGSIGGAVAMNAGSFGHDTLSRLYALRIYAPETGVVSLTRADCEGSYRHCAFFVRGRRLEGWSVVLEATFALTPGETETGARMRDFLARKHAAQPVAARSAGCVFRNPAPGVSAGRLLDEAGFRGRRLGGMAFSEQHANFLVNLGNGRTCDAIELMLGARDAVKRLKGYTLCPEVRFWPPVAGFEEETDCAGQAGGERAG